MPHAASALPHASPWNRVAIAGCAGLVIALMAVALIHAEMARSGQATDGQATGAAPDDRPPGNPVSGVSVLSEAASRSVPRASPCALLAQRFPALAPSLATTSSFCDATWINGHAQTAGLTASAQAVAPTGLNPVEQQAWLAMAARAARTQSGLEPFFPRRFTDGFAVRAGLMTVWSLPIAG